MSIHKIKRDSDKHNTLLKGYKSHKPDVSFIKSKEQF